jgi:hypothetical protein
MKMRQFFALGLILVLLTGVYLHRLYQMGKPTVEAMESHRDSKERLRHQLNWSVDRLRQQKEGIPYERWTADEKWYYSYLRGLLEERGQHIPERPDESDGN